MIPDIFAFLNAHVPGLDTLGRVRLWKNDGRMLPKSNLPIHGNDKHEGPVTGLSYLDSHRFADGSEKTYAEDGSPLTGYDQTLPVEKEHWASAISVVDLLDQLIATDVNSALLELKSTADSHTHTGLINELESPLYYVNGKLGFKFGPQFMLSGYAGDELYIDNESFASTDHVHDGLITTVDSPLFLKSINGGVCNALGFHYSDQFEIGGYGNDTLRIKSGIFPESAILPLHITFDNEIAIHLGPQFEVGGYTGENLIIKDDSFACNAYL